MGRKGRLGALVAVALVLGGMVTVLPSAGALTNCTVSAAQQAIDAEEAQMLTLINQYRAANGLGPLTMNPDVTRAATWFAVDMATKNYFPADHIDSFGRDVPIRLTQCDVSYTAYAENIAGGNATAAATFSQWQNSATHNANMLNPNVTLAGVARAFNAASAFGWYWVLNETSPGGGTSTTSSSSRSTSTSSTSTSTSTSTTSTTVAPTTTTSTSTSTTLAPTTTTSTSTTTTVPVVLCNGLRATIVGTGGNDSLRGTSGDDVIAGLGGYDQIDGLGGNDVICGGEGNDRLFGGPGNDTLLGEGGNDDLSGDDGNDALFGGTGDDRLHGGAGTNTIDGGPGTDACISPGSGPGCP